MQEIVVPDIGGATNVDVIEVMIKPGDVIEKDQSLIMLESDKASMEIPSPANGVVKDVKVRVGDKVTQGAVILLLEGSATAQVSEEPAAAEAEPSQSSVTSAPAVSPEENTITAEEQVIVIPDIGGATNVDVIAVEIAIGDEIEKEQALVTLEGDKATMDIPAPFAGKVTAVHLSVGDKASAGDKLATVITTAMASQKTPAQEKPREQTAAPTPAASAAKQFSQQIREPLPSNSQAYAGPAVRRFAREIGADLSQVTGSGRKGRITKADVQTFVKQRLASGGASGGLNVAPQPEIDFSQFGAIEERPLNKIKKLTAANLHRNWVTVPHVTQFAEADITELEKFRQENKGRAESQGFKFTPLVFIMKALVVAMQKYPQFNASLSPDGQSLILKKYFNIGVAVDTPNGLVVAVIRDVEQKGLLQLASELFEISKKARDKGLSVQDMQGSCMTISSLGGIGGTAFTPIVNSPDVAILGVSKSEMKPVYYAEKDKFKPRLMLPLSLSYDHRVIDGAEAARFACAIAEYLSDIRLFTL